MSVYAICVSAYLDLGLWAFMQYKTTFDNGSLGSRNDEERSESRYVV